MPDSRTYVALLLVACSSKKPSHRDDAAAPPARDAAAECDKLLTKHKTALAPLLAKAGIKDDVPTARTRTVAGLAACRKLADAARTCLLQATADASAWTTCNVEPPFVLYDGATAHDAQLGAPVSAQDSARQIAELDGKWRHPGATPADDTITWKISKGALAVHRQSKAGGHDEPPHTLKLVRERLLAIETGTSRQNVPFFRDGDRIYLSWTSGALAIPIANEQKFALDEADGDRWLIRDGDHCTRIDPRTGVSAVECRFEDRGKDRVFVAGERAWLQRAGVLIHPAMEIFTR